MKYILLLLAVLTTLAFCAYSDRPHLLVIASVFLTGFLVVCCLESARKK